MNVHKILIIGVVLNSLLPPAKGLTFERGVGNVLVEAQDCRQLVEHPTPNGITYKPAIDVRGQPVIQVELPVLNAGVRPEYYEIDIDINLLERTGGDFGKDLRNLEMKIGVLTVDRHGNIFFNGDKLGSQSTISANESCKRAIGDGGSD